MRVRVSRCGVAVSTQGRRWQQRVRRSQPSLIDTHFHDHACHLHPRSWWGDDSQARVHFQREPSAPRQQPRQHVRTIAHWGASRGAKNFGNQPPRTTGPGRAHPGRVAQWRRVTTNGNKRRATYKQEAPGSSPGPPTSRSACSSSVFASAAAFAHAARGASGSQTAFPTAPRVAPGPSLIRRIRLARGRAQEGRLLATACDSRVVRTCSSSDASVPSNGPNSLATGPQDSARTVDGEHLPAGRNTTCRALGARRAGVRCHVEARPPRRRGAARRRTDGTASSVVAKLVIQRTALSAASQSRKGDHGL
jgi:hypothetical protein